MLAYTTRQIAREVHHIQQLFLGSCQHGQQNRGRDLVAKAHLFALLDLGHVKDVNGIPGALHPLVLDG